MQGNIQRQDPAGGYWIRRRHGRAVRLYQANIPHGFVVNIGDRVEFDAVADNTPGAPAGQVMATNLRRLAAAPAHGAVVIHNHVPAPAAAPAPAPLPTAWESAEQIKARGAAAKDRGDGDKARLEGQAGLSRDYGFPIPMGLPQNEVDAMVQVAARFNPNGEHAEKGANALVTAYDAVFSPAINPQQAMARAILRTGSASDAATLYGALQPPAPKLPWWQSARAILIIVALLAMVLAGGACSKSAPPTQTTPTQSVSFGRECKGLLFKPIVCAFDRSGQRALAVDSLREQFAYARDTIRYLRDREERTARAEAELRRDTLALRVELTRIERVDAVLAQHKINPRWDTPPAPAPRVVVTPAPTVVHAVTVREGAHVHVTPASGARPTMVVRNPRGRPWGIP